jgi:hypothetical protein
MIVSTASASIRQLPMNASTGPTRTMLNLVRRICNLNSNFSYSDAIAKCIKFVRGQAGDVLGKSMITRTWAS